MRLANSNEGRREARGTSWCTWRGVRALQETCSEATERRSACEVRQLLRAHRQHRPTVTCEKSTFATGLTAGAMPTVVSGSHSCRVLIFRSCPLVCHCSSLDTFLRNATTQLVDEDTFSAVHPCSCCSAHMLHNGYWNVSFPKSDSCHTLTQGHEVSC